MAFKNWFANEISIRLPQESDCFVSTVSYSITIPKIGSFRFKRVAQSQTYDNARTGFMGVLARVCFHRNAGTKDSGNVTRKFQQT